MVSNLIARPRRTIEPFQSHYSGKPKLEACNDFGIRLPENLEKFNIFTSLAVTKPNFPETLANRLKVMNLFSENNGKVHMRFFQYSLLFFVHFMCKN